MEVGCCWYRVGCSEMLYGDVVMCEVLSEAVSQAVRPSLVRLAMVGRCQRAKVAAVSSSRVLKVSVCLEQLSDSEDEDECVQVICAC
jgi:hypothetical protein